MRGVSAVILRPRPFVTHRQEFHRTVRDHWIREGRTQSALDQVDVAAMGADQFGGDRQSPNPLPPGRPEVWNAWNRCSRAFGAPQSYRAPHLPPRPRGVR